MTEHSSEPDTVLIEELGICRGQSRVDITVVNGLLHGYEIKSDRDSLRRLQAQVDTYGKVLNRATLVVGERHFVEALTIVPSWWGLRRIVSRPDGPKLKTVRRGRENPGRDPRALVELLWHADAAALLVHHEALRGVRGKPRRILWDRICERLGLEEISSAVRAQLKARAVAGDRPPRRL